METNTPETGKVFPHFLTGFTDADGCFYVDVAPGKLGRITPIFYITQQSPPEFNYNGPSPVLLACQDFFGVGHFIRDRRDDCYTYRINSAQHLHSKVIPHFSNAPLHSEKKRDFHIFCQICTLLAEKKKGDQIAWQQIKKLAYTLNRTSRRHQRYWSPEQAQAFKEDSKFSWDSANPARLHPEYVSGLTQGDGSFSMSFSKTGIMPIFSLGSHNLSLNLLYRLKEFFQCGQVSPVSPTYSRFVCKK